MLDTLPNPSPHPPLTRRLCSVRAVYNLFDASGACGPPATCKAEMRFSRTTADGYPKYSQKIGSWYCVKLDDTPVSWDPLLVCGYLMPSEQCGGTLGVNEDLVLAQGKTHS
jgi:hypothetical protein